MDEIALKKGKGDYVVILVDLDTHQVIDLLQSRLKDALIEYFTNKGKAFCEQIEVFCSDMWTAYLETAKELFVNATIVVDRFHYFSYLQDVIDKTRKKLRKSNPKQDLLKKTKWTLFKNPQDLSKKEAQKLIELWTISEFKELKQIYDLKNEFRAILQKEINKDQATILLDEWVEKAKKIANDSMNTFIEFYQKWQQYILNYFTHRVSTSLIEGINNKIKLIKRRGFGFASFTNFRRIVLIEFLKS
jgi:transposase